MRNKKMQKKYRLILYLFLCCMVSAMTIATDLSAIPFASHDELAQCLTVDQINEFFSQGYLIIPDFFDSEELHVLSEYADRLQEEAQLLYDRGLRGKVDEGGAQFVINEVNNQVQIARIVWAGGKEPYLLELGRQQKVKTPIAQLLDADQADHLINQLHYKLPRDQVKFCWHQDFQHRRNFDEKWEDLNKKGSFVQLIVAIDPMTIENGPLEVIPGLPEEGYLGLDKCQNPEELLERLGKPRESILLNAGDAIFMHPLLIHGSRPNHSLSARRVFINGFAYPHANHKPYPGAGSCERILLRISKLNT